MEISTSTSLAFLTQQSRIIQDYLAAGWQKCSELPGGTERACLEDFLDQLTVLLAWVSERIMEVTLREYPASEVNLAEAPFPGLPFNPP